MAELNIKIRRTIPDDAEGIHEIEQLLAKKGFALDCVRSVDKEKLAIQQSQSDLEGYKCLWFTVDVYGKFEGHMQVVEKLEDPQQINCEFGIGLLGNYERRGIGTALYQHLQAAAVDKGIGCLTGTTHEINNPIHGFNKSIGMKKLIKRPTYIRKRQNAIFWEKSIK